MYGILQIIIILPAEIITVNVQLSGKHIRNKIHTGVALLCQWHAATPGTDYSCFIIQERGGGK